MRFIASQSSKDVGLPVKEASRWFCLNPERPTRLLLWLSEALAQVFRRAAMQKTTDHNPKRKLGTRETVPRLHFGLGYSNLPLALETRRAKGLARSR